MPRLSDRQSAIVLAAALFFSYAYFYQAGGWNQNSRFGLVRAIIERHTVQLDGYDESTGDKAVWQGHYYSDKPPGVAFLAVPPTIVAREISRLVHVNPSGARGVTWTSYAATLFTCGLFTLIAALLVMRISLAWGYSRRAAIFAATAYGLASPAWCYATLLMEHAISAGCLMLAYAAALTLNECVTAQQNAGVENIQIEARISRQAWLIGLWTGLAGLTELQTAIPSSFIVVFALLAVRDRRARVLSGAAARILAGGMISGIAFFGHNWLAFGSPLRLGYGVPDSPIGQLHMSFFGLTYPTWWRLREILVGSSRGLLPISPLIALTPIGLAMLARTSLRRRPVIVAAAVAGFYVLFNASYYYWEGGWAYGPRQMTPALPFLALGLAPLWDSWGRWGRVLLSAGWVWGVALTLIAVSTTPQPPSPGEVPSPVTELLWPAFRDGDLSLNNQGFLTFRAQAGRLRGHPELHAGWNLGELVGLHGLPTLLPLGLVWSVVIPVLLL